MVEHPRAVTAPAKEGRQCNGKVKHWLGKSKSMFNLNSLREVFFKLAKTQSIVLNILCIQFSNAIVHQEKEKYSSKHHHLQTEKQEGHSILNISTVYFG